MKYSQSFERLLDYAAYDCAVRGETAVAVDHLLMGLYREDFPLIDEVLASFRVDSMVVLDRLLSANPESRRPSRRDDVGLGAEALGAIAEAEREAEALGHATLTPPHTLLGILSYNRDSLERYFIRDEIIKEQEDEVLSTVRDLVSWLRFPAHGTADRELDVIDARTVVGIESRRLRSPAGDDREAWAVHVRMLKQFRA